MDGFESLLVVLITFSVLSTPAVLAIRKERALEETRRQRKAKRKKHRKAVQNAIKTKAKTKTAKYQRRARTSAAKV